MRGDHERGRSVIAFFAGGVAVILASRGTARPFRYLWMPLGAVSLVAITLGIFRLDWAPVASLGEGGIELATARFARAGPP